MTRGESTARVYVKMQPEGLGVFVLAQVDTGAPWSILDREVAEGAGVSLDTGEQIRINTQAGTISGRLVRHPLTLIADEGESLHVEATIFVPDADQLFGRTFLGYGGFLQFIRMGLDPQQNHFYFGPAEPVERAT